MPATERVFWRTDTCTVWVGYGEAGELVFDGYDRAYLDGYEYRITIAPGQFDSLRRALGGDPSVDIVDQICARVADIMGRGERAWLNDHGIENEFSCY